jgi:hypothetical protein
VVSFVSPENVGGNLLSKLMAQLAVPVYVAARLAVRVCVHARANVRYVWY